jgi:hypothetical protein
MTEGKLTEEMLRKMSVAERAKYPRHVLQAALLTTLEQAREILMSEGWEFVAIDDQLKDEPGYDPLEDEDSEVWRRAIGGVVEWCELCHIPFIPPELPPEQCWSRQFWPCDPRTIEI